MLWECSSWCCAWLSYLPCVTQQSEQCCLVERRDEAEYEAGQARGGWLPAHRHIDNAGERHDSLRPRFRTGASAEGLGWAMVREICLSVMHDMRGGDIEEADR
ncbi:hypothetical protein VFPFJ_03079 [Purpureocillium lilacinum]|nr:hypothetical protein VFPFJ_03079 [Purpureocillium lilacinum]OAQ91339.1 hypothetical protein VFPFJ_03079 [Purpureocillium lilacinum]